MFGEMDPWLVNTCYLLAAFILVIGIIFIKASANKKKKEKHLLPLIIIGWIMVIASIVGAVALFVLYIGSSSGITGTMIFIFASPIFIIGGIIACLTVGINSLQSAYRKPKEDVTRKQSIVKGWALLILVILVIVAIVVTLSILLTNYSNYRNEHPVRFM